MGKADLDVRLARLGVAQRAVEAGRRRPRRQLDLADAAPYGGRFGEAHEAAAQAVSLTGRRDRHLPQLRPRRRIPRGRKRLQRHRRADRRAGLAVQVGDVQVGDVQGGKMELRLLAGDVGSIEDEPERPAQLARRGTAG